MEDIKKAVELYNNEKYDEAENIALDVLKKNPEDNDALDVLAAIFLKIEKSKLLQSGNKKNLRVIRNIAIFLNNLKMYPHAIAFYQKALQIEPRDAVGLNNLGLLYEDMQEDEKAKKCYEKSLQVTQNFEAFYNLGVWYRKQRDIENGIKYITKALKYKPEDWQTNYSLGMLHLTKGDFETGYKHFLKRKTYGIQMLKNFWNGEPRPDDTVLVFCDYGLGDAIMFSRYFPCLKSYFKKVKVFCSPKLKDLFENSFPDIEFYSTIDDTTTYDYSVLAMNLPYFLKMDFSKIPSPDGYLKADDAKVKEFKEKYFNTDKLKVGLFWIGGEKEKRTARNRLMPLYELQELFENKNIQFYSFQVEDPFEDVKLYPNIVDLGKDFKDFSDTAAAMKNLDLFISIDSAVIHLAGALGIKSYLMLPKCSEWRWFQDTKKTIWYDSVELFIQKELYDWSTVTSDINDKLNSF